MSVSRVGRVVDLSHPLSSGMPVFPGDPEVLIVPAASIAVDGFRVQQVHLGTHSGTHLDAPSHTVPAGATVEQLSLGQLIGPARIVHVPDARPGSVVTLSSVRPQLGGIEPGMMVFVHTGWSQFFGAKQYFDHPVLDPELAAFLLDIGVRVLGVDTLSPDPSALAHSSSSDSGAAAPDAAVPDFVLPVHELWLGSGGVIIENLTRLGVVPWPDPTVVALPLRIPGADGSPIRAVALEPGSLV